MDVGIWGGVIILNISQISSLCAFTLQVIDWSFVDTCYFWLVTFTTVGFGDVHFPLEVEIDHFYELVVYRVFGLAFLAGIIEAIYGYVKYR